MNAADFKYATDLAIACGPLDRVDAELKSIRDLDRLEKLYDQIKKDAANRCALISHRMDQIRGS